MEFEIKLFGPFQAIRHGEISVFPTHPTENLAAFLACNADKAFSREDLAERIWPSVETVKAQNRLRTALVHLRQALNPWMAVQTDRQTVTLSLAQGKTDLLLAESLHRRCRLAQGQDEERRSLEELLSIIDRDFLEGWSEEWTAAPREHWRNHRNQSSLRLGRIYLEQDLNDLAISETERVLGSDPYHEEAWALYLRTMVELDQASEASDHFRSARRRLRAELELDFSPELLDLGRRIGTGQVSKKTTVAPLSNSEKEVISRAVEGQFNRDPYSLLPILTSEAFRAEAMQHPMESWHLVRRVVEATEGTRRDRIQLMALGITLADMVDDLETGLDYGEWIIENLPETDVLYGRTLSSLGFLCFEVRDWEAARRYLERNLELSKKIGDANDATAALCQMASLLWHEGNLDEAERLYHEGSKASKNIDSIRVRYNRAIIQANLGFVMTIRQDWPQAEVLFERAHSAAVANKFDYIRAAVLAPLAASRLMNNKTEGARQMASQSLSQTYRSRYRRMNQISADYAAITLVGVGHKSEGVALLDRFADFRQRDRHERSPAEESLAAWTKELAGNPRPHEAWMSLSKPSDVVAKTCDLLEQI